jgi:chromodomain-helicase-DNA-binding protein 4
MDADDDHDASLLMAAFRKNTRKNTAAISTASTPRTRTRTRTRTLTPTRTSSSPLPSPPQQSRPRKLVGVFPSPVKHRDDYVYYEPIDNVAAIIREFTKRGDIMYQVNMSSGTSTQVSEAWPTSSFAEREGGRDSERPRVCPR